MTEITIPLELLITGIAGLLAFGIGGTWKVVHAIAAGRSALKKELKMDMDELWNARTNDNEKWDRKADAVHKRIGDLGKADTTTAIEVARVSAQVNEALRVKNGNGSTATRRTGK